MIFVQCLAWYLVPLYRFLDKIARGRSPGVEGKSTELRRGSRFLWRRHRMGTF